MRRGILVMVVVACGLCAQSAMAGTHGESGCSMCHVPHKAIPASDPSAAGPLWTPMVGSGQLPLFAVYTSPTFDRLNTGITQPDGSSKLCLGCHDGSYGGVSSQFVFGDGQAMTLTESHPISFTYGTALSQDPNLRRPGALRDPATALSGVTPAGTIATDLLDANSKMQCSSCHDVHHSGIGPKHLRYDYESDGGKRMCTTCHNK